MIDENEFELNTNHIQSIIEQKVRVVLNSIVFDPMTFLFSNKCIQYFFQNSIARCFESLSWYQPIVVKCLSHEIDSILPNKIWPSKHSLHKRKMNEPACSLIERIMINDFCLFTHETQQTNQQITMNFNRVETFINDKLYFQGPEYLQRDIQLNTPLNYLVNRYDQEIDTILSHICENVRHFYLPLTE